MAAPTLESLGTFGYLPDPPKRASGKPHWDFATKLLTKLSPVHAGDIDLRSHTTETDQLSAGSCAGNATADAFEVLNSIEGLPHVQLSRLFIYTLARNFMDTDGDGKSDIDKDEGTYIYLCLDVVARFGVCREDVSSSQGGWPYDLKNLHTLPSLKAMRRATGHRLHSYYRINETGDDRSIAILEALKADHPVIFGTQVDSDFIALRNEGPVGPPSGATVGGHAMLVVGYIHGKGFIIKNSWGSDWGDGGFCIMKPEYLTWSRTQDLWVPTKGTTFK